MIGLIRRGSISEVGRQDITWRDGAEMVVDGTHRPRHGGVDLIQVVRFCWTCLHSTLQHGTGPFIHGTYITGKEKSQKSKREQKVYTC